MPIVEVRSYEIVPGQREALHAIMLGESLPLLQKWKQDVVVFGPSPHDDIAYLLLRAYPSVAELHRQQDAFYGSDDWRKGPRESVISKIGKMSSVALTVDEPTLGALRNALEPKAGRVVEVRGLEIVPGERDTFADVWVRESRPLLDRWKIDVVAHGPSPADDVTYGVIRAFGSLADRQAREDAFYDSSDWRQGPRQKLVPRIGVYTDCVLFLAESTIDALRHSLSH